MAENEKEEYIEVDGHKIRKTSPSEEPVKQQPTGAPGLEPANSSSNIKLVIGVVSGKGGVGKSLVTSLTASLLQKSGIKTAILDADVTGPSIPKMFGLKRSGGVAEDNGEEMLPGVTESGIKIMSLNLLMPGETDPVIWRGPVIAGVVKQFWTDVQWGDVDVMLVDMPPGTGDVPLTVFQSLPVDSIVVVTTPQELVSMIVEKALNMAAMMNIDVCGVVENMSYIMCPHCGKPIYPFGEKENDAGAIRRGIDVVGKLPLDPSISALADKGEIEGYETQDLELLVSAIKDMLDRK